MLLAVLAVLSAVFQTYQAVKDKTHPDEERDVLKVWTILGVFIPFHFYLEAVLAFVPFSSLFYFIPQIIFSLFYVWLSVPSLRASAYVFDQLQPVVHARILPVVHSWLVVVFCAVQSFFLRNFITVLPREDLDALHESALRTELDLRLK